MICHDRLFLLIFSSCPVPLSGYSSYTLPSQSRGLASSATRLKEHATPIEKGCMTLRFIAQITELIKVLIIKIEIVLY